MPSNSLNKVSEIPVTTSFISLFLLPACLIIFPTGINLIFIVLLSTWFNDIYIPKPTGFCWVPGQAGQFYELALVVKSITTILNKYVFREMTTIKQIQILPPSK
jgi:hypothetical protein